LTRLLAAVPAVMSLACTPADKPRSRALDVSGAAYGRDFRLTDPQGNERTLADYRGKVVMLFFGFVQCPDVCPTALLRGAEVLQLLGDDGSRVQGLFVTLDPERDTAETLLAYATAFHPSFIGLRADLQRTKETAEHFKVYFRKVPSGGTYTLEHSAMTYVYDPAGSLRLALRAELSAREVADDVALLLPPAAVARPG
jgi:protein SCO1/2